jgi:hypothetical protein
VKKKNTAGDECQESGTKPSLSKKVQKILKSSKLLNVED